MKEINQIFVKFIEDNKIKKSDVADRSGLSRSHFHQILNQKTLTCHQFEKICNSLGLACSQFFHDVPDAKYIDFSQPYYRDMTGEIYNLSLLNDQSSIIKSLKDKIDSKDAIIEEKDKQIHLLEEMIDMLKEKK